MGAELPWLPPVWLARALERVRGGLQRAHRRLALPPVALLELAMGAWLSQALWAAAQLGVADALAAGPRSTHELADQLGTNAEALRRVLRALSAHGVFEQRSDGRYAQSALSHHLRSGTPGSLRDFVLFLGHPKQRSEWSKLDLRVRNGHSPEQSLFERMTQDRELGEVFDAAMSCLAKLGSAVTHGQYDFARFGVIVDVGGGRGANLAAILADAPRSQGVLFDLPEVVAHVQHPRMRVEGGSFFERVPEGGDAYLLKHVLHDWNDERALTILRTVRRAMPAHGTLVIIESVLPDDAHAHMAKLIDLEMLVIDGKERSEPEWRTLLTSAGFPKLRIVPTAGPVSILEAAL